MLVRFLYINCSLNNNNLIGENTAFLIKGEEAEVAGNIQLNNIVVVQPTSRAVSYFLYIDGKVTGVDNVSGDIYASGGTLSTVNTINFDVTASPIATPIYPSANSLSHHWKMDEAGSSIIEDSIGTCDGLLLNSPAWAIGKIGGGLTFNGTNQFVTIADDATLDIGIGDFSVSLWMQRSNDATTNKRLLYKGASDVNQIGYALAGSNTALSLMISNGVTRVGASCAIPSLNQWHHFVFTVNRTSGKATLYMNGIYQSEMDINAYSGADISNARALLIGAENGNGNLAWPGKVDDVRTYGRVLAPGEIAYLAASASAWWKFDDGSGSVVTDDVGRSSGILQNNPTWTTGKLGGALALNGINQFVSFSNNSSDMNIGTGDFSISLWMQRSSDATTNKRLLCKGASNVNQIGYALTGSDTMLYLLVSNGVTRIATSCAIPSLNQWHHFVFTINRTSGKTKLYMNGIYQSQMDISSYTGVDISNARTLLIGAENSNGNLAWPGKIDDVRIYKRVLTVNEALQLYLETP